MNILTTKSIHIDVKSPGILLFSVFNSRLANKINKVMKRYGGIQIKNGEEAVFSISASDYAKLKDILPLAPFTLEKIENFFKNASSADPIRSDALSRRKSN